MHVRNLHLCIRIAVNRSSAFRFYCRHAQTVWHGNELCHYFLAECGCGPVALAADATSGAGSGDDADRRWVIRSDRRKQHTSTPASDEEARYILGSLLVSRPRTSLPGALGSVDTAMLVSVTARVYLRFSEKHETPTKTTKSATANVKPTLFPCCDRPADRAQLDCHATRQIARTGTKYNSRWQKLATPIGPRRDASSAQSTPPPRRQRSIKAATAVEKDFP